MPTGSNPTALKSELEGLIGEAGIQFNRDSRLAVKVNHGTSNVLYTIAIRRLKVKSTAVGLQYDTRLGPVQLGVGGSAAFNDYQLALFNPPVNRWHGNEYEGHVTVAVPKNVADIFWVEPWVGFRALDLVQNTHLEGTNIIAKATNKSRALYGGVNFQFRAETEDGRKIVPWFFGGFSYEFEKLPPLGQSVFSAEHMAGNHFIAFPTGALFAPNRLGNGGTAVGAIGLSAEVLKGITLSGGYMINANRDFVSQTAKIGISISSSLN